jgi:hypothetical protein
MDDESSGRSGWPHLRIAIATLIALGAVVGIGALMMRAPFDLGASGVCVKLRFGPAIWQGGASCQ